MHFSWSCPTSKIISTVPRHVRNSHWLSCLAQDEVAYDLAGYGPGLYRQWTIMRFPDDCHTSVDLLCACKCVECWHPYNLERGIPWPTLFGRDQWVDQPMPDLHFCRSLLEWLQIQKLSRGHPINGASSDVRGMSRSVLMSKWERRALAETFNLTVCWVQCWSVQPTFVGSASCWSAKWTHRRWALMIIHSMGVYRWLWERRSIFFVSWRSA